MVPEGEAPDGHQRPPTSRRTLLGFLTLLAIAGGVMAWSAMERREDAYNAGIERSLLRYWALKDSDLRDEAAFAGVSLNRPRVTPLDRNALGELADSEDFHAFFHRCTSCHTTPDPSMHSPGQWNGTVARMQMWMERAGLLPIDASERDAIVRFLDRAAAVAR